MRFVEVKSQAQSHQYLRPLVKRSSELRRIRRFKTTWPDASIPATYGKTRKTLVHFDRNGPCTFGNSAVSDTFSRKGRSHSVIEQF